MKWARLILLIPVLLLTAVFGYLYWGAQAEISVEVKTAPAQEHRKTYESVVAAVQNGIAADVYTEEAFTGAENYTLASVQVTMENPGALPMEWVTCEYAHRGGDVALYAIDSLPQDIAPGENITFELQLIRYAGAAMDYPTLTVTYYVAGQEITRSIGG